ncbi:MAG TPA: LamG domain-containing protein [Candidatus Syntrophoarchaeum butanivorans]|uniref:LamG domain-containing protein n=1 Tax=Candidatus Syntropharchaeum butanivorans TaxID=1839936 RepID=A0A7C0X3I3_9EURY|nr:LamG domain-containing protein [Candidatus Syntrophoarchaeum butanivorans]
MGSDEGVSVVVSVVLLLGLLVAVSAIVHVTYVPEWRRSAEADHMDDVFEDISEFKSSVDLIAAVSPASECTISQPIRMGGGSIPVISPEKSGCMLRTNPLLPDLYITADNCTTAFAFTDLGSIELESDNIYEIDRTYVYENGGLILKEINRSVMVLTPSIILSKLENGTKALTVQVIDMDLESGSIASSGVEEIYFTYRSSTTRFSGSASDVSLTIRSNYPDAWKAFLMDRAKNAGFNASEFNVTASQNVELDIYGDVILNVVEVDGDARIRPVIEAIEPTWTPGGGISWDCGGWWKLDEGSGTTATDSSGNDNHGTIHGATWSSGYLHFDGSNDYVSIPDNDSLEPQDAITLAAWVKWERDPSTGHRWANIISKYGDNQYLLQHNVNNQYFEVAVRTDRGRSYTWSSTEPQQGVWYHVAGVYDGSEVIIYVNGTRESSRGLTGNITTSSSPVNLGRRAWTGDRYFNGVIYDARIYCRALTPSEIQALASSPPP